MQLQNSAAPPFHPPIHGLQPHQVQPISTTHAADYGLKRRYLSLLQPQQIIDICLSFEVHAPHFVRNTVWPHDLDAAIRAIQQGQGRASSPQTNGSSTNDAKKDELPIMDSLLGPPVEQIVTESPKESSESSTPTPTNPNLPRPEPPASEKSPPPPTQSEPQPQLPTEHQHQTLPEVVPISTKLTSDPDSHTTTTSPALTTTTQTPTLGSSSPAPAPQSQTQPPAQTQNQPQPPAAPRPPHLGYTHQPYGFATAGPSPYPFTSYYPPQWGAYPHIRYGFPPFPGSHPQIHGFPPPPPGTATPAASTTVKPQGQGQGQTQGQARNRAQAPSTPGQPHQGFQPPMPLLPPPMPIPDGGAADDLPSYEDMIVEILSGLGEDSDGLAPKDLWTWMASRYPVQSNFRPSASQALQKAFKKGRFEKSESGRYRLNGGWRGGSVPRKGTRRPQLQSGLGTSQGRPPPFTNAPLMRGSSVPPQPSRQSPPSTTGMFGYGTFTSTPSNPTSEFQAGTNASGATEEDGDAFEAAQHILKAISGGLLRIDANENEGGNEGPSSSATAGATLLGGNESATVRGELQAQLALLVVQLQEIMQDPEEGGRSSHQDQTHSQAPQTETRTEDQTETDARTGIEEEMPGADGIGDRMSHPNDEAEVEEMPNPNVEVDTEMNMREVEDSDSDSDADMDEVIV
ncbi:hypothetical protein L218DRAFT_1074093 [Marasmius fiardii PR-910]|nr:hypothetical protein L218DRAFT_1074093 [Marasmius fiardii PR-910]